MPRLDVAGEKRRQIYLAAFPAGAVFVLVFVFIERKLLPVPSMGIAIAAAFLLLAYEVILWLRPHAMAAVEASFYFFMVLFFPVFGGSNLNSHATLLRSTPEYFGEVINGMTVWEVILFVGAFLAVSPRAFKYLSTSAVLLIVSMGFTNTYLLFAAGRWGPAYLFHWLHALFALGMTILVISRIGRIQQMYATTDPLTGLLNRRAALDFMHAEFERAARYQTPFSVILVDIDHFKRVNDTFGHTAGDRVLAEFAGLVSNAVRKTDRVARWGGEEFLVILPQLDVSGSRATAERIREMVCRTTFEGGQLTVSMGVCACHAGQNLTDVLHCADQALYEAKRTGRNRAVVSD